MAGSIPSSSSTSGQGVATRTLAAKTKTAMVAIFSRVLLVMAPHQEINGGGLPEVVEPLVEKQRLGAMARAVLGYGSAVVDVVVDHVVSDEVAAVRGDHGV